MSEQFSPFESASELREEHARLLETLDRALQTDSSTEGEAAALRKLEPNIRQFLERGAATGIYLEEIRERTACQVLLDYWVSSLSREGVEARTVRLARFDGEKLPDLKDKPCPYVGLEAFRDQTFFFGREADTKTLLARLSDAPLVVVLGASGSGKSSLVMGGVLPALAKQKTLRIAPTFVPGNAVLKHLVGAITESRTDTGSSIDREVAQLRTAPDHLGALIGGPNAPPVLISIDKFEEVFTLSSPEERQALVANLAQLLQSDKGHRVILTVREEFRSRMVELSPLRPFLDKAWYSMRPMGYEELRAAIERPAALVNLQYQSGIVDDLVKKVLGQPAALPLLQFTLRALWETRDRNRITWEVYRKVGDPLNALKTSADQFYDGLAHETQTEVRRVLLELVRVDELLEAYRQPVPRSRLLQAGKANTDEVLQLLAKNDYIRVTSSDSDTEAVVEVKHESLIRNWPRFVAWIDEKRHERRQRLVLTEAAARWAQSGRPQEGLLTGWQLQESRHLSDLSVLEREFIEASSEAVERIGREKENALRREAEQAMALAETERQLRKRTTTALVLAVVTVALISALSFYFYEKSNQLDKYSNRLSRQAKELEMEKENLQNKYNELQGAYDDLFAKQLNASESQQPSKQPLTIFIHISAPGQRGRADELAQQLKENGIIVPGVQSVNPVSKSQVRYFHKEDQKGAEGIVKLLKRYLGVSASIEPDLIKGSEKVPLRNYEIWFAPDAFQGKQMTTALKVPEMVTIRAGTFQMGNVQGGDFPRELPVHTVTIPKPFAIGRYEVTFDEYDQFAKATNRKLQNDQGWGRRRRPVLYVSWEDANAYAKWLSEQADKRYRLPTEAEWEYAARAGKETNYWWGNDLIEGMANCDSCGSQWDKKQTAPVGSFEPNEFGLYDTAGNVWEWVQDCYHEDYTGAPPDGTAWEPKDPKQCALRVYRGGSWLSTPLNLRSSARYRLNPAYRSYSIGFRLAQDLN